MSINPADSAIFGSLYGTDEIRALFSDRANLQFMLDVEAALARAEAKLGLVPKTLADAITRAARAENLRLDYIADSTRRVGYPVAAIVKELGRLAGEEAAHFIHLGATTQRRRAEFSSCSSAVRLGHWLRSAKMDLRLSKSSHVN